LAESLDALKVVSQGALLSHHQLDDVQLVLRPTMNLKRQLCLICYRLLTNVRQAFDRPHRSKAQYLAVR